MFQEHTTKFGDYKLWYLYNNLEMMDYFSGLMDPDNTNYFGVAVVDNANPSQRGILMSTLVEAVEMGLA
jgi:hypothetical protein